MQISPCIELRTVSPQLFRNITFPIESLLKGTVSVISSDPPCEDGKAYKFTMAPLKALSDQVRIRY